MKKRIISMITAGLLAATAAITLAACGNGAAPASNDRSIGGVASAYAFVHGGYVGEATVTVDKDGDVLWIDFAEWLMPAHYAGYSSLDKTITAEAASADTTLGSLIDGKEIEMPSNFDVFKLDFTAGTVAIAAKLVYNVAPRFIRIGTKVFELRPTSAVKIEDMTAGLKESKKYTAGYFEITGKSGANTTYAEKDFTTLISRVDGAYPTTATAALAKEYAIAARAGEIAYLDEAAEAVAGAFYAADGRRFVDVAASSTAIAFEYKASPAAKAAAGLALPNVTLNKMDKENTYWAASRTQNIPQAYKKNVNAMREFFMENGFDFAASDFTSTKTGDDLSEDKAWKLSDGTAVGLNDGTAFATLSDFAEYFNLMKSAFTAAKANIIA